MITLSLAGQRFRIWKIYFSRVGNCQRRTPLSCLCMHKEHQRLVWDPQMDDLNVTLAGPQRQKRQSSPQNSQEQLPLLPPPTSLSFIPSLYLFVYLSSVASSLWFSYLTLLLFVLPPLSLILSLYHPLSCTHTASLLFSLMISTYRRQANSAAALNEKWHAIATALSPVHWRK